MHSATVRKMTNFTPSSVVLYREARTSLPLWPAIYCTDDVAPQWFLRSRPIGHALLVLKLAKIIDASHLRWATTTELNEFDPFSADDNTRNCLSGLAEAYEVALDALECGLGLDHWKSVLAPNASYETIVIDSDDDESNSDPRICSVIETSLAGVCLQQEPPVPGSFVTQARISSTCPNQPPSYRKPHVFDHQLSLQVRRRVHQSSRPLDSMPTSPSKTQMPKRPSPLSLEYSDNELPSPPHKRRIQGKVEVPEGNGHDASLSQFSDCTSRSTFVPSNADDLHLCDEVEQLTATELKSPMCQLQQATSRPKRVSHPVPSPTEEVSRDSLKLPTFAAPDTDIIGEELDDSSQIVQVFIGPEVDPMTSPNIDPQRRRHKLHFMKHDIWERPYFRDALSGRNYFTPIGNNTWELTHPRLVDILPEDFAMVAEFLSDGDFGIRNPESAEQASETFVECMSAWKTAELLSMDDLLEHIVKKIRAARPWWDMWDVMAFACSMYESNVPLQAHDDMKAMLSESIAEMYDIYVEDDHLRSQFMARLKQLPHLRRDVHAMIVTQADRCLQGQEQDEGETKPQDEDSNFNTDLYE